MWVLLSKAGLILEWVEKQFWGSILEILLLVKPLTYVCRIKSDAISLDIRIPLPAGNHASLFSSKGSVDVLCLNSFKVFHQLT